MRQFRQFQLLLLINIYQIQSENQNMNINIKLKISSLLRRGQNFYCLSYDWDTRQIVVHYSQDQYCDQLKSLQKFGMVKRAQCYLSQIFEVSTTQNYLIYMISFGDFRKGKMVRGENPISKGLGVCLFDYVYFFLDDFTQAQKRMEDRIQQMEKRGQFFHRNLMIQTYCRYFRDKEQNTETQNFTPQKILQQQNSFQI